MQFQWSPWLKAQHAHSHGAHAFTHTLKSTQLQLHCAKRQFSYCFSVLAGSFHVSIIHWTLTWTIGSLSCIRDHSCVCVYTQGLSTPTASQHNIFESEKLTQDSNLGPLDLESDTTTWATPSPKVICAMIWLANVVLCAVSSTRLLFVCCILY